MLELKNVCKTYKTKNRHLCVGIKDVSLTFGETGMVFISGKSGSGKTTLLNAIGGLDTITSGKIILDGKDLASFSRKELNAYRNNYLGFIFQDYNFLEDLSIFENIALALQLQGEDPAT